MASSMTACMHVEHLLTAAPAMFSSRQFFPNLLNEGGVCHGHDIRP
jgi:hypothetical protein